MGEKYLFTSESVGEGHPDKVCDAVSDVILDACISEDPDSRVAVETMVTTQFLALAGEVTTKANVDFEEVARRKVREIGYVYPKIGFDYQNMEVLVKIHEQSSDISQGVTEGEGLFKEQGAGDQGMMFGFACNETPEFMPLPIILAHRIVEKAKEVRNSGLIKYIYPDCKSQVTVLYEDGKPKHVDTVVFSTHHNEEVDLETIRKDAIEKIIQPVCGNLITEETKVLVNPTGRFAIGGPNGDSGVTGRKIIVDTYGGMGRHGGGAFSGKDPSKVDRSAAYAARWVAKNIVAAGLADKCEVQLSYAIGYSQPLNITIDTFGTEKCETVKIERAVRKVFDLSPRGIVNALNLRKPIYQKTAAYGHFGRKYEDSHFTWEKIDKSRDLITEVLSSFYDR